MTQRHLLGAIPQKENQDKKVIERVRVRIMKVIERGRVRIMKVIERSRNEAILIPGFHPRIKVNIVVNFKRRMKMA